VALRFPTGAERPDLRPRGRELAAVWPEFMHHDPVCNRFFGRVRTEYADLQFFAWDDERDQLVAEGNALPAAWDGDPLSLPDEGLDAVLEAGFTQGTVDATVLCALQIMVAPGRQGEGVSRQMIERMSGIGREAGFQRLIAPVRPSLKHRYPLAPIGRYITWRRPDGLYLDPWLRTHERLGGEILKVAPKSMTIPGTVGDWERWTGMAFPESGRYVVPGALEPIEIDRERDEGVYVEPNVWMVHQLTRRDSTAA
jgi:GNAT superfamily N-acetyltransferase